MGFENGLVSIVLPIYNVEKYLDRSITSVVNQTYKKLEIILVDDGSLDRCPQMCEEWAKKDSRIKVVHKENAGLGMARNTGIENAHGEYICFFDSDDYIASDTIKKVMLTASQTEADLILFGHYEVDRNNHENVFVPNTGKKYYKGDEVQSVVLPAMISFDPYTGENANLGMSACMSAYRYSLIHRNEWRFVSERDLISEDVYSILCLMKDVQSVAVIPEAFYYYCENGTSLSHTYREDRYDQLKTFYIACMNKCNEFGYNQDVKERFAHGHMNNVIAALKQIVTSGLPEEKMKEYIKDIVADEQLQQIVHGINIRRESLMRRLMFSAIRGKQSKLVYLMVRAKA